MDSKGEEAKVQEKGGGGDWERRGGKGKRRNTKDFKGRIIINVSMEGKKTLIII